MSMCQLDRDRQSFPLDDTKQQVDIYRLLWDITLSKHIVFQERVATHETMAWYCVATGTLRVICTIRSKYWICFPQSPDDVQYQINRIPTDLDRTLHFTPLDAPYHFLTSLSPRRPNKPTEN
jgi:hypothetical protein